MASIKLIEPKKKPRYYQITANDKSIWAKRKICGLLT